MKIAGNEMVTTQSLAQMGQRLISAGLIAVFIAVPNVWSPIKAAVTKTQSRSSPKALTHQIAKKAVPKAISLSLADAVFIGLRKSPSIRSAYADRAAQKFDLRVAEDVFTPHAVLAGSVLQQDTAGVATRDINLSPTVVALTPVGTIFNFAWNNDAATSPGIASRSSVATFSFSQPLLRGAGLDVNLAPVRSARIGEDLNQLNLRSTISETITTIINAYRELLRSQEAKILADDALNRAQALVDIDKALIKAGRMAEVEIVQAQADVENQKLTVLQAEGAVDSDGFSLAALLDLDLGITIVARDKPEPARTSITVEKALEIAFARRPDYVGQSFIIEQAKLGIVVAENQRLWDVSLVGGGSIGQQVDILSGSRPIRSRIADASIGARLSIPINDLTPEQNALHASTSRTDAEIQLTAIRRGVEQQIRTSVSNIDLSWRQIEIARRARTLAASAVEIEKLKLNVGRSSNFEVQTLEASFRAAENQQLNAMIDYLTALSLLDLQLGTTLDTWKVSLQGQ